VLNATTGEVVTELEHASSVEVVGIATTWVSVYAVESVLKISYDTLLCSILQSYVASETVEVVGKADVLCELETDIELL